MMYKIFVYALITIENPDEYELQFICREKHDRITYRLTGNFSQPIKIDALTINKIKTSKKEPEIEEFTAKLNSKLSVFAENVIRYCSIFKNSRQFIFVMEMEEKQLAA